MAVIDAFEDAWTAVWNAPGLLVAGLLVAVVGQLPAAGELTGTPLVSGAGILGWVLVFPFVAAGFIGMALQAIRGTEPSLARFVRAGRTHYVRMLVATILLGVVLLGLVVVSMIVSVLTLVPAVAFGEIGVIGAFLFVGLSLLTPVLIVLALLFLQFYGTAVVVEGEDSASALRRSVDVVRRNFTKVVGFSVLWGILTNAFLAPEYLMGTVLTGPTRSGLPVTLPDASVVVTIPVVVLATGAAFAYFYTVHTAYYVQLIEETPDEAGDITPG